MEIAHEALITQWPWLQNTINEAAADMRVLDRLMDKARRWNITGSRDAEHLATGAERTEFAALAERRSDWLSTAERNSLPRATRPSGPRATGPAGAYSSSGRPQCFSFALAAATAVAGVWAYREHDRAAQGARDDNSDGEHSRIRFWEGVFRPRPADGSVGTDARPCDSGLRPGDRLDPKNAVVYVSRGYAYEIKGDAYRATQDYDQAIRLDPKNAVVYVSRGGTPTRARAT